MKNTWGNIIYYKIVILNIGNCCTDKNMDYNLIILNIHFFLTD